MWWLFFWLLLWLCCWLYIYSYIQQNTCILHLCIYIYVQAVSWCYIALWLILKFLLQFELNWLWRDLSYLQVAKSIQTDNRILPWQELSSWDATRASSFAVAPGAVAPGTAAKTPAVFSVCQSQGSIRWVYITCLICFFTLAIFGYFQQDSMDSIDIHLVSW